MADQITIAPVGEHRYAVTLQDSGTSTEHIVSVPQALITDLGLDPTDEARLLRVSFEFLLDREGPGSILRQFDLDVIGRYFPEYLATMRRRVRPQAT